MRPHRSTILWQVLLLLAAAGVLQGQTLLTLGAAAACGSLTAGQSCTLTGRVDGIADRTLRWSQSPLFVPGFANATTNPGSNGNHTNTYTAPSPVTQRQTILITVTAADGSTASAQVTVVPPTVTVQVTPSTVTLIGGQTQRFTASVFGVSQNGVTWTFSPQVGTLNVNGNTADYTPPGGISTTQRVTITATSTFDPGVSGSATVNLSPLIQVGSGAPTDAMVAAFQGAWNRNAFNALVSLPPVANVRTFGSSGYVQEFTDVGNSSLRHALVTGAASTGVNAVFQIRGPLWAYYSTTSANTAGYPLGDSQACSAMETACVWGTFDRGYALFSYTSTLPNGLGPNFAVNGAFFTEWTALGGISALGSPVSAQSANVTAGTIFPPATAGTTATVQTFARGAIYSITNNANRGRIFGVVGPLYELYVAQSGPSGSLGMPTSEAYQVSATVVRQNFEGGVLQTGGGDPTVLLPVTSIAVSGAQAGSTVTLNVGQTLTLQATAIVSSGEPAPDRPVSWSSTNGKVVSILANGGTAVVTAVGSGAASVQAASGGVASAKINFVVISPCCQVGEGAPGPVRQAFQDALSRNRIAVQTPLPSPAERVGGGYVQMAPAVDGRSYLLALSDRLGAAYVVSGALLTRYQALGGPAGALGYPAGDASGGGTQLFSNNSALAGNPVRVVSGSILAKWALLGYENGAAGFPVSDASGFATPGGNSGQQQRFGKGAIYGATVGPRAGQTYFASGLILARYDALGGPAGDFGMPVSEEFVTGGVHQQNFEGGQLTYANGDAVAVERAAPRVPGVVASPGAVSAGGRARIAVIGFPNASTLRISVSGSPDFTVTAANGAYTWDMAIPLNARSGSLAIRAVDGKGASAEGALTIRGFADNRVQITKVQGDNQTGLPGSVLPLALRVAVADQAGAPVAGAPLVFTASPGAQVSTASAVTDAAGRAEVWVRLPGAARTAAVNVSAPSIAQSSVTFNLLAAAESLANFPKLMQAGAIPLGNGTATIAQKGALLTAVAAILRHHQNRGELRAPNGPADPAQLNDFLRQFCMVDTAGAQVCDGFLAAGNASEQVVNLWRAAEFTGGLDVIVRGTSARAAVDALAEGSPALISLALTRNGSAAGGHFVVATGVGEDGSILIHDPNPALARASLSDYLRGFSAGGVTWSGELRGVVQFSLRNPSATRFLVGTVSQSPELLRSLAIEVQSAAGACGTAVGLADAVDGAGSPSGGSVTRMRVCDGTAAAYQLAVGASQAYRVFVTDLAAAGGTLEIAGSAPATYKVTRDRLKLVVVPQDIGFAVDGVVNAATFEPGIAPGGIMSIFGSGLAGGGTPTRVEVEGVPATVLSASPFQVNAVVPPGVQPGRRTIEIGSGYGIARQAVDIGDVAPAVFLIGSPAVGAVVNQDGSLNGPASPLPRGQTLVIYATGLGAVVPRAGLSAAAVAVTVVLGGVELPVAYAGLTPGYPGLYQVNVAIPNGTPPGLGLSLTLKQGSRLSNVVAVAVQ